MEKKIRRTAKGKEEDSEASFRMRTKNRMLQMEMAY